jgi:hypothetical protein
MNANEASPPTPAPPWWRVGMVWLVVGGPLAVVVASLVTVTIAYVGAEEVLTQPTKQISTDDAARLPAMQGRNHVATPRN